MLVAAFWFMYMADWFGDLTFYQSIYNISLTSSANDTEKTWYAVLAVIQLILTLIVVIFFITSRKAIRRLIAILKESCKVFKALAAIIFWPLLLQLPLELAILCYGIGMGYFVLMVWTDLTECAILLVCHIGIILWTLQFVKATVWTSMSGAVAEWYVRTKPIKDRTCKICTLGCADLWQATGMVLCKHLGSMALGSLIIAICQLIRLVLASIDYYTKDLQDKNLWLKLVMKCSQCVMWCLQKTIEFISYYGYVFVAIKGHSFCRACFVTFGFVAKYMTQTVVNKAVQGMLRLLIGWTTPVACGLTTFFILDSISNYDQYNPIWAGIVVFVVAYVVADGIVTVYDCIIDTIYLSAFQDMERPGGPKYMSDDLRKGFGLDPAVAAHEAGNHARKYVPVGERKKQGVVTVLSPGASNPAAGEPGQSYA